jgi:hypothetical protein
MCDATLSVSLAVCTAKVGNLVENSVVEGDVEMECEVPLDRPSE